MWHTVGFRNEGSIFYTISPISLRQTRNICLKKFVGCTFSIVFVGHMGRERDWRERFSLSWDVLRAQTHTSWFSIVSCVASTTSEFIICMNRNKLLEKSFFTCCQSCLYTDEQVSLNSKCFCIAWCLLILMTYHSSHNRIFSLLDHFNVSEREKEKEKRKRLAACCLSSMCG